MASPATAKVNNRTNRTTLFQRVTMTRAAFQVRSSVCLRIFHVERRRCGRGQRISTRRCCRRNALLGNIAYIFLAARMSSKRMLPQCHSGCNLRAAWFSGSPTAAAQLHKYTCNFNDRVAPRGAGDAAFTAWPRTPFYTF